MEVLKQMEAVNENANAVINHLLRNNGLYLPHVVKEALKVMADHFI